MNRSPDGRDSDEDLLARIAENDARAVRGMVVRKLPRIVGLASRLLSDRAEAEDVAQDAFLRVWRQAPKWKKTDARFDTWLHRVVLNLCYDRLRRRREQPVAEVPETADTGPAPDSGLRDAEEQRGIDEALASLPERQREAIVLQYYQGLSNVEAAAVMDISVEALESLLSRARRNLRAFMKSQAD